MRTWMAFLALFLCETAAAAQVVLPVEPFTLTSPDFPVFGQSVVGCDIRIYPPNRSGRRGSNPSVAAEQRAGQNGKDAECK
jgi:hypothetical protein